MAWAKAKTAIVAGGAIILATVASVVVIQEVHAPKSECMKLRAAWNHTALGQKQEEFADKCLTLVGGNFLINCRIACQQV